MTWHCDIQSPIAASFNSAVRTSLPFTPLMSDDGYGGGGDGDGFDYDGPGYAEFPLTTQ
jgi:hypothetical protein